jgi:hypothetical protein
MSPNEKATMLLSRAEVSLAGAEEVLKKKKLNGLSGELEAVNTILGIIRKESTGGVFYEE